MWKKDEATPTPDGPTQATPSTTPPPRRTSSTPSTPSELATIGRSITIKGEVSGDEDLLIQGHVEGSVDLELQTVTVGREGQVKANITGRVVTVEGEVEGDLKAQEQVILRSSARVKGDISAPRVVLEDGASFRGLVDMSEPKAANVGASKSVSGPAEDTAKKSTANGASSGSAAGASPTSSSATSKSSASTSSDKSGSKGGGDSTDVSQATA